jgi:hypothetical protein
MVDHGDDGIMVLYKYVDSVFNASEGTSTPQIMVMRASLCITTC